MGMPRNFHARSSLIRCATSLLLALAAVHSSLSYTTVTALTDASSDGDVQLSSGILGVSSEVSEVYGPSVQQPKQQQQQLLIDDVFPYQDLCDTSCSMNPWRLMGVSKTLRTRNSMVYCLALKRRRCEVGPCCNLLTPGVETLSISVATVGRCNVSSVIRVTVDGKQLSRYINHPISYVDGQAAGLALVVEELSKLASNPDGLEVCYEVRPLCAEFTQLCRTYNPAMPNDDAGTCLFTVGEPKPDGWFSCCPVCPVELGPLMPTIAPPTPLLRSSSVPPRPPPSPPDLPDLPSPPPDMPPPPPPEPPPPPPEFPSPPPGRARPPVHARSTLAVLQVNDFATGAFAASSEFEEDLGVGGLGAGDLEVAAEDDD